MSTASSLVGKWVDAHPLHATFLADGLLNLSALARHIQPELQKQAVDPISIEAVTLALHRLHKKMSPATTHNPSLTIKGLSVQSDVALIYFPHEEIHADAFSKAIAILHKTKEYALYSRGTSCIALLAKPPVVTELSTHFRYSHQLHGLVAITLATEKDSFPLALRAHIFQQVETRQIPIHETFSSYGELTLVIDQSHTTAIVDCFVTG